MSVHRCRACLQLGHNRATCPAPKHPGKYLHRGRWRSNDPVEDEPAERLYIGLDDYILKHLGRVGVTSQELYQRVVDDYGPVVERTFYRHLKALRAAQRLTVSVRPMNQGYLYSR